MFFLSPQSGDVTLDGGRSTSQVPGHLLWIFLRSQGLLRIRYTPLPALGKCAPPPQKKTTHGVRGSQTPRATKLQSSLLKESNPLPAREGQSSGGEALLWETEGLGARWPEPGRGGSGILMSNSREGPTLAHPAPGAALGSEGLPHPRPQRHCHFCTSEPEGCAEVCWPPSTLM